MKKTVRCIYILFFLSFFVPPFAYAQTVMSSTSAVDWTNNTFYSTVLFDAEKAGIFFPSGKSVALDRIVRALPKLIKDPLLTICVDSSRELGDLILDGTVKLDAISEIINNGHRTPVVFSDRTSVLETNHSINLLEISSQMIKHGHPYYPNEPVSTIASRPYTGIIIDARGALDVHGEFIKDYARPCFFPKIWDSDMNLIYERNMMDSFQAKAKGIVVYGCSDDELEYQDRVGTDPMRIVVNKIYGENRTDPIISNEDALRILSVKENMALFESGKVVILLDKDHLVYNVKAPVKDEAYYVAYKTIKQFIPRNDIPGVDIDENSSGFNIQIDLLFYADSDKLLPSEEERITKIAQMLNQALSVNDFTFRVSGHTADVGKPEGEMRLSVLRAQSVIDALTANGVPKDVFTYQGFGGTQPVASNATAEGRAQNRRVEIFGQPKGTYIQRE